MSQLHKLVQAARVSADAKDFQQVKKYLDQMNEVANNIDDREQAQKKAEEQASKAMKSTGGGASGGDDPQKK